MFLFKKKIEGEIGYYNLQDWWFTTLTDNERKHIEDIFHPMGRDLQEKPLTEGKISSSSGTASSLLWALAGWFKNYRDIDLAIKIINKAYEEAKKSGDILDLHFTLSTMIEIYYYKREEQNGLEKVINLCKEQIEIAPLALKQFRRKWGNDKYAHEGYERLAIILEKQQKFNEAIGVCLQAKKQGWTGEWDKRINRMKDKNKK